VFVGGSAVELLNTSIEKLCDRTTPQIDPVIKVVRIWVRPRSSARFAWRGDLDRGGAGAFRLTRANRDQCCASLAGSVRSAAKVCPPFMLFSGQVGRRISRSSPARGDARENDDGAIGVLHADCRAGAISGRERQRFDLAPCRRDIVQGLRLRDEGRLSGLCDLEREQRHDDPISGWPNLPAH